MKTPRRVFAVTSRRSRAIFAVRDLMYGDRWTALKIARAYNDRRHHGVDDWRVVAFNIDSAPRP